MFRKIIGIAAIFGTATSLAAAERLPEILAQSGKWEMNYDTDSCHLFRPFGTGDATVYLKLTRYSPGDGFEVVLYGKRFPASESYSSVVSDFGSDGTTFESRALNGNSGNFRSVVVGGRYLVEWDGAANDTPPSITPEQEQAVSDVTFRINRRRPVKLLLGPMGAAMQAMRACTDSLVKLWGFDPVEQAELSRRAAPKSSPGDWLRPNDYPIKAIANGSIGLVHIRLDVAVDGSVSGCHVQAESSPADFSTVTCRAITRRATFDPALDKRGKPTPSYYIQSVRWVMGNY